MHRDYTKLLEQGYSPDEVDDLIAEEEHEARRRKRKENDDQPQ